MYHQHEFDRTKEYNSVLSLLLFVVVVLRIPLPVVAQRSIRRTLQYSPRKLQQQRQYIFNNTTLIGIVALFPALLLFSAPNMLLYTQQQPHVRAHFIRFVQSYSQYPFLTQRCILSLPYSQLLMISPDSSHCNSRYFRRPRTHTTIIRRNTSTNTSENGIPIHMLNVTTTGTDVNCMDSEQDDDDEMNDEKNDESSFQLNNNHHNNNNHNHNERLSWDKFEYGTSPKVDSRFGKVEYNHTTNSTKLPKEELLEQLHQQETIFDQQYSQVVATQNQLWESIPKETVQMAIECLQTYIQSERIHRIQTVLQQRTSNVRFLFESM